MTLKYSEFRREQQLSAVRLVSVSNVSGTYSNGPSNTGLGATLTLSGSTLTIDSVAANNGDRVALVAQSTGAQNGIYIVSGVGTGVVLTRTPDFQVASQMRPGLYFPVAAGTVYGGSEYVVIEPAVSVVGTDTPTFGDTGTSITSVHLANNGLNVLDASGAYYVTIEPGSTLTAARVFTLNTGDAARTLDVSAANVTITAYGATLTNQATKLTALAALGVKYGTTASWGGGSTSHAFTATGLLSTDVVTASILTSTNSVSITKVVPTTDTLTITFSADPGASTTVQWHGIATV